jgi:hypothetical protein
MWPAKWTKSERELDDLLDRWRGVRAQGWEYSVSHGQLLVRLYREGANPIPSAYVLCKDCYSVQFEPHWNDSDIRISMAPGRFGNVSTVTDRERLSVSCGAAFGAESDEFIAIRDGAA